MSNADSAPAARPGTAAIAPKPSPGATANGGGWFTDAMLSALKKHEASEKPANKQAKPDAVIDVED